jgi:SAM-dependent methyltransferase
MANGQQADAWSTNLATELEWWRRSLSGDSETSAEHRQRVQVKELQPWIRDLVRHDGDPIRVLDVGSGPLTPLGCRWPDRVLEVVAVDPLADSYNELLDALGLDPPVRPVPGRVETLTDTFPPNHFDLVFAGNSLDHCADPIVGIKEMLAVLKPGHVLVMKHGKNEGQRVNYQGLHQWNLCPVGSDMAIGSRDLAHSVRLSALAPGHAISIVDEGKMFVVLLGKPE